MPELLDLLESHHAKRSTESEVDGRFCLACRLYAVVEEYWGAGEKPLKMQRANGPLVDLNAFIDTFDYRFREFQPYFPTLWVGDVPTTDLNPNSKAPYTRLSSAPMVMITDITYETQNDPRELLTWMLNKLVHDFDEYGSQLKI